MFVLHLQLQVMLAPSKQAIVYSVYWQQAVLNVHMCAYWLHAGGSQGWPAEALAGGRSAGGLQEAVVISVPGQTQLAQPLPGPTRSGS